MPGPFDPRGIQGEQYSLPQLAQALAAAGFNPQAVQQLTAISARENPGGNTSTLNPTENPSVAAVGPFQFVYTSHPDYDRQQAAQSLQYTIDYMASHFKGAGGGADTSPWTVGPLPGGGYGYVPALAADFTSPQSRFVQAAQAAIAQAGIAGGGGSQPISAAIGPAPSAAPATAGYANDDERAAFLSRQNYATLGPDARTFLDNYGGQQQAPAVQPLGPTVAPGQQYAEGSLGDEQRYNYLSGLVARGVSIAPDAQNFINNYNAGQGGGRAQPRITPPSTGDGGLQAQAPAQPVSPYIQGLGGPYGNQTTVNNGIAQNQYDANTAAAQQASQQTYLNSPAVAGALAAQQPQAAAIGPMSQGDTANAQQGGAENAFQQMSSGGSAIVGRMRGKKKKGLEPTLPVGAPFPDAPPPAPMISLPSSTNGDVNNTPGVSPVAMPVGMQPGAPTDAMPVNSALDNYWNPRQYAGGGTADVGLDPNDPRNAAFGSQAYVAPPAPVIQAAGPSGGFAPGNGLGDYAPGDYAVPNAIWNARNVANGYDLAGGMGPTKFATAGMQGARNNDLQSSGFGGVSAMPAPPLNEPVDTRLQAARVGLLGYGVDPRLMDLGGISNRIDYPGTPVTFPANPREASFTSATYYTPGNGPAPVMSAGAPVGQLAPNMSGALGGAGTGVISLRGTELGTQDAVRQGDFIHEAVHNLETYYTPQDRQRLAALLQIYPVPPVFNIHHPDALTGYFDAQDRGGIPIPEPILNFINGVIQRNAVTPGYASGGTTTVGPGSVHAPEEIVAIGVQSGRPYFTAGEVGPEKVTIKPMQDGGSADVGLNPDDPRNAGFGSAPYVAPQTGAPSVPQYNIIPPNPYAQYGDPNLQQFNANQNVLDNRQANIGASQNVINAQNGVLGAQGNTIPYQQGVINAQGGVLNAQGQVIPYQQAVINAQRATIGPQGQYIGAQGNVISAQQAQTAGQRGYIGQEQQANAQSTAEEQAYQAATHNLPDLAATGAAQSYQDSTDYLYRLGGVVPAEVDTRGAPLPAGSPTNVRAKIQSQADILKANNTDAQKLRSLQLEGARLAVDLLGTDVQAAQEAAARVGLTVDQAKLLVQSAQNDVNQAQIGVSQAELAKGYASNALDQSQLGVTQANLTKGYAANALDQSQLGTTQAQLDLSRTNQPPAPGLVNYTNPYTGIGQWVTPAEKAQLEANIGPSSGTTKLTPDEAGYSKLTKDEILVLYASGRLGEHGREVALSALMMKGYSRPVAVTLLDGEDAKQSGASSGTSGGGSIDTSSLFKS